MRAHPSSVAILVLLALAALPLQGWCGEQHPCTQHTAAEETTAEMRAEVPALSEFHEVIYPLWHTAWPEKDYALMKELLPQVQEHVKAVRNAELPGILRDKKEAWNKGIDKLTATLAQYEGAADSGNDEALRDAVEVLHSDFESLIRVVRPPLTQLDLYHVELYKIYHHDLPDKKLASLREHSTAMSKRCEDLSEAEIPRWHKDKAEKIEKESAALCELTMLLEASLLDEDWKAIDAAVEAVHTQYRTVEAIFE